MQPSNTIELTTENLQTTLESSATTPVLLLFWAQQIPESFELYKALLALAPQYGDDFQLATVDCEKEQMVASQFGIQALPTLAFFKDGQGQDALMGPQELDAVKAFIAKNLPSADEKIVKQASVHLEQEQYQQAFTLLEQLSDDYKNNGQIKLALAKCLVELSRFDEAETYLANIPLEYQQADYKELIARVELHKETAEMGSEEIDRLTKALEENPENVELACELAKHLYQSNQQEESLALLWSYLKQDLNALDGQLKKDFMDLLTSIGQANPITSKYRRQLYSLMY